MDLPASALIKSDFLKQITNNSCLHTGEFLVVILAVIVYHIIIEKTTFGYPA